MEEMLQLSDAFRRFMLEYQAGIDEVLTKINILRSEFKHMHEYSPIEHVSSRLKSFKSIVEKMQRHGAPITLNRIRETMKDIAGIRIVCSFIKDTYRLAEALTKQKDITVLEVKDYIETPKPNGYQSLHLIVSIPVFLSNEVIDVPVEIQIRTIAMDFWASLEHKIYYKFDTEIPDQLQQGLYDAATTAAKLDAQMEQIHEQVLLLRPGSSVEFSDHGEDIEIPSLEILKELLSR